MCEIARHTKSLGTTARQRHAYVGSYTGFTTKGQLGWVGTSTAGNGISIFKFDDKSGKLTPADHPIIKQDCPTWLELHPDGKFLIAVHELSHHLGTPEGVGFITSYRIEDDGNLTRVGTQETKGNGNTCAAFDRTGGFILVTRYWDGGISVLPFDSESGAIGPVSAAVQHSGSGPHPLRQSAPHPHGVHGHPSCDLVFAMDLGTDKVHQYRLSTETGGLTPLSEIDMGHGSGPRGIVFHPSKPFAYVNNELGGTMVTCALSDDGLKPLQTISAYPKDFVVVDHPHNFGKASFWTAEAKVTHCGKWLYVICRVHHSLAIFSVGDDGLLEEKGRAALVDFSNARNLTLDPTGKFLLVASQDANLVEVFRINSTTGELTREDTANADCAADVLVV